MKAMKRYLIIFLAVLVFASGVVTGCGQNQNKQHLEKLLLYFDTVNSIERKYLEANIVVLDAAKSTDTALDSGNVNAFIKAVSNQNGTIFLCHPAYC